MYQRTSKLCFICINIEGDLAGISSRSSDGVSMKLYVYVYEESRVDNSVAKCVCECSLWSVCERKKVRLNTYQNVG